MAKKPTVSITGMDNMLLIIEGRFKQEMDKKVLDVTGPFITAMDSAAKKVFKAMATDVQVEGLRARPVMGTHTKTPSFLSRYIPDDQSWRPLNKKYLKRKKTLVALGRMTTANLWENSGSLKKIFSNKSASLTAIGGNSFKDRNFFNKKTNTYSSRPLDMTDPKDKLFHAIVPAQGRNVGRNSLGYDIEYNSWSTTPTINRTSQHKTKIAGAYPRTQFGRLVRTIEFDVFGGFAKFVNQALSGAGPVMSPEDFIAEIKSGGQNVYKKNGQDRVWDDKSQRYVADKRIKDKLYYFTQGKRQQRALIQPYIRYYYRQIMIPLARKLIVK